MDGLPVPTNQKVVINFISPTEAYISASFNDHPEKADGCVDLIETDVKIKGNTITMTNAIDQGAKVESVFEITSINDKEFTAIQTLTVIVNGVLEDAYQLPVRFAKVEDAFSADIIGMWEGHVTSDMGSEFDDGETHRWEFLLDGSFNFFRKEDGSTYIATFEMKRVDIPTQEEVEKFIQGIWMTTVINGQEVLTDQIVYEFESFTKAYVSASVNSFTELPSIWSKRAECKAVIGIWEGKNASVQDANSQEQMHRLELKADGTYVYYNEDGESWTPSGDTLNEYFVVGNLLCMRWINEGTEYREWWEIESIEDGVMKCKAIRHDDNGITFTPIFDMTKVE